MQREQSVLSNLPSETVVCTPSAFIDPKEYELPLVPRSSDKAKQDELTRQWQANGISNYPIILNAYTDLLECWENYHPVPKTKKPG